MQTKISELPETLNIKEDSVFPVVYEGITKKVTFKTLMEVLNYFTAISYNKTTGEFTFTKYNGEKALLNTDLQESIKDVNLTENGLLFTKQNGSEILLELVMEESDPTVPEHVKKITQEDINKWNEAASDASDINYDNSNSELESDNVQDALDELAEKSGSGDGILTGSVIGYNGEEIPEGYEEVETDGGIETITNENGTAIKFPDGRLECRLNTTRNDIAINSQYGTSPHYSGMYEWNFPVAFINNPIINCTMFRWGTGLGWGTTTGASKNSAILVGLDTYSREAGTTVKIQAVAYGYWK